jgi:hypothetical protein
MDQPSEQSITYKLDKAHFQECFEQSAPPVNKKDYLKAIILGGLGIALFFVEAEHYYIPFFIFCLAVVELLSVKYRKTWWVWRQLMSKAGNSSIKLTICESGIKSQSKQVNTDIAWDDLVAITKTDKGFLLKHHQGVNYISTSHLSESMLQLLMTKSDKLKSSDH